MSVLTRYILKRCLITMVYTVFAMGFVLILPHVEPLIRSLAIGQISFSEFWTMWILLYPMIFYLQMPLIVAFSIGLVYLLMARDKEITMALAAGASPLRLATPGALAALAGAGACALLSLYLLPVTILEFKDMAFVASKRVNSKSLEYGKFNTIYGGYTVYFRGRTDAGYMQDVILKDASKPGIPVMITAKRGLLNFDDADISLILFDGTIQKPNIKTGNINLFGFSIFRYPIGKKFNYESTVGRAWGYFERHIGALLDPPRSLNLSQRERASWMMEGNKRIINPIMCLGYGILIIGIIGWFNTRVRNVYWIIPFALVIVLGIHSAYIVFLSAYVKFSSDWPEILYGVPALVFVDGALLLYLMMREKKPRPRGGRERPESGPSLAST